MIRKNFKESNPWVLLVPFVILIAAITFNLFSPKGFLAFCSNCNTWILDAFSPLFSYTSLAMVLLCGVVMFSPLGKVKIGGEKAQPILSKGKWFSVILCTTVAVGILFWGTAEPLYHLGGPPSNAGITPQSNDAANFAMSTMFMHWSFTPYAIYAVPALLFAIGFYNKRYSFSLSSMFFSFSGGSRNRLNKIGVLINILCLVAVSAGMAASLGAGILSISGGLSELFQWEKSTWMLLLVSLAIVVTFIASSVSGLQKGIKNLSLINISAFIVLCLIVLFAGPTGAILKSLVVGVKEYVVNFIPHSTATGKFNDPEWNQSWTTFYWANWMAWAPISALFLGRISYGYTIRQFLLFNWIFPSLFSIFWMAIFSGSVLHFQMTDTLDLMTPLNNEGPESIIYYLLNAIPFAKILIPAFVLIMFLSFVTAADSNTTAMSSLSASDVSPESPEAPKWIKYLWGILIGAMAFIMINLSGVDGVKMLSNLGGLPALFILIAASIALIKLLFKRSF